jgi:hypothetical protein
VFYSECEQHLCGISKQMTRTNFDPPGTCTTVDALTFPEFNMLRSIVSTLPRTAARVALRNASAATRPLLPAYGSSFAKAMPAFGSSAAMRAYTTSVAPEIKRASVQCMCLSTEKYNWMYIIE